MFRDARYIKGIIRLSTKRHMARVRTALETWHPSRSYVKFSSGFKIYHILMDFRHFALLPEKTGAIKFGICISEVRFYK